MSNDCIGTVTIDRLKRMYAIESSDNMGPLYSEMLLERYLKQQMKNLSASGYCDIEDISTALKLFGIKLSSTQTSGYGENTAFLNRKEAEIKWCKYDRKGTSEVKEKIWTVITAGGKKTVIEKIKPKQFLTRRPFNELPADLQQKILDRKKN